VLPNLIPITVGMGLLGLTGISLRFSTMIGFPVAFGLAVDDTIHFLARYRKETEAGRSPQEAVEVTLATTGRGMVMTSAFLIAGYFVMFLSNYLAVLHMGFVICVILAAALLSDLFVTPALVLLFPSLARGRSSAPHAAGGGATAVDRAA